MKTYKYWFIILIITLISCSKDEPIVPEPPTKNAWDEDITYFSHNLKQLHPNLFSKISSSEFDARINKLYEMTDSHSADDIIIGLQKILTKIGDSHTVLANNNSFSYLPIRFEWVDDGLFVTHIADEHESALGQKLTKINNVSIQTVIDSFRTVVTAENEAWFRYRFTTQVLIPEYHKHFGFTQSDNSGIFTFENGSSITLSDGNANFTSIYTNQETPLYLSNSSDYYWHEELNDLLYIQYNKCKSRNDLSMGNFVDNLNSILLAKQNITKVVLDIRMNTGGNSGILKPLITRLDVLEENGRLDASSIYIIIGQKTYSSGILNAYELKQKINPVFIGEATGGRPNHYGDIRSIELPNSKIKLYYSTRFWSITSNDTDSMYPDVDIKLTSADLLNFKDPVMEWIKEQ